MNLIDAIIILIVIIFAIVGLKRGFLYSTVAFGGIILVIILSFVFKNYVSIILYENLPFFNFNGFFKNISVINIIFYEIIAFLVVAIVLSILLKIAVTVSKIIEKILKLTIVLSIPSKLAGAIVGAIEGYVICFAFVYFLSLPIFNVEELKESRFSYSMLENTPILSGIVDDSVIMMKDFEILKSDYSKNKDANEFNLEVLDLFLKYDILSIDSADKLIEKNKLKINNAETVLSKYRKEVNYEDFE